MYGSETVLPGPDQADAGQQDPGRYFCNQMIIDSGYQKSKEQSQYHTSPLSFRKLCRTKDFNRIIHMIKKENSPKGQSHRDKQHPLLHPSTIIKNIILSINGTIL